MLTNISIGATDLSFHHVAASLVANILRDMGLQVSRIYSSHEDNFNKLKIGNVDLLCSAWLPSSHGIYKSSVEEIIPLIELGLHYEPFALWGVPDYISEDDVSQISDLLKPDVLKRMTPTITQAGITRFSIIIMDEYGLKNAGYEFFTGSESDCFDTFERAVKNKE